MAEKQMAREGGETLIVGMYSPKPGMGASTVARQLAVHAASENHKVLLVELDYRYPSTAAVWQLADRDRCLETAVLDAQTKRNWKLNEYLMRPEQPKKDGAACRVKTRGTQKLSARLHVLAPSGLRGFEQCPEEPETFISDLLRQTQQQGFQWVVLDIPSEIDSVLALSALQNVEVCILLLDETEGNYRIAQQRMSLMQTLGVPGRMLSIHNRWRPGRICWVETQKPEEWAQPVASFPFVGSLGKSSLTPARPFSWRYRKALRQLFQVLLQMEKEMLSKKNERGLPI
ncbi:hypothetical protein [Effusibacillus consociatus]|uniref:AAA domain-containing protein n=1 Tax=Effusibacillus consociatus TaxID=1117041 RepID=A0ABV9Q042_9BACL